MIIRKGDTVLSTMLGSGRLVGFRASYAIVRRSDGTLYASPPGRLVNRRKIVDGSITLRAMLEGDRQDARKISDRVAARYLWERAENITTPWAYIRAALALST